MSNPIQTLKELMSDTPPTSVGIVSSDRGSVALIATSSGLKEVPKSNDTLYVRGDSVRIFNGVIVSKVKSTSDLPIYYV